MRELRQSIARDVMVLLVLSSDHVTGATGKALTITASKNGAAFAGIAPTVTERGNGWYAISLTAVHTNTLGDLALHITAADTDPLDVLFDVKEDLLAAADFVVRSGTAAGGAVGYIELDAGASATDDYYNGQLVVVVDGTGAGQARLVRDYTGATKRAFVDGNWITAPDNTSVFRLLAAAAPLVMPDFASTDTAVNLGASTWNSLRDGSGFSELSYGNMFKSRLVRSETAAGGTVSWIVLDAGASAVNDLYSGLVVSIVDGTGAGQSRVITNYDGVTKEASTDVAWATAPDNTSVYRIWAIPNPLSHVDGGGGGTTANNIADAIWGKPKTQAGLSVGSYGELLRMLDGRLNGMMVMDNVVNGTNGMTSARIRIFEDEADVGAATDGGSGEGEVATFEIEATFEGVGKVDVYRARRTA